MNFNKHYNLEGRHAFLGGSKGAWVNYTSDKLRESYFNHLAKQKGTELHELAYSLIKAGQKLPRTKQTLNMYVNDAIGYKMEPEVTLKPFKDSYNCFGSADTMSFRKNKLRIHDYKSGVTPAKMVQLEIYTAYFCLEYDINPNDIEIELRIYQNDDYVSYTPLGDDILYIMNKTKEFDKILNELKED